MFGDVLCVIQIHVYCQYFASHISHGMYISSDVYMYDWYSSILLILCGWVGVLYVPACMSALAGWYVCAHDLRA